MTEKEKANLFIDTFGVKAVFVVEEIIEELKRVEFNYDLEDTFNDVSLTHTTIPYYERIKQHILELSHVRK